MRFNKNLIDFLLLFFMILLMHSCSNQVAEEVDILLPKNFVGNVLVVFDVEGSTLEEYMDGKRIYRIPDSGILETEFPTNYGLSLLPRFYYYNEENKTEIPYVVHWDELDERNDTVVSTLETGNNSGFYYLSFVVGSRKDDSIGVDRHKKRHQYFNQRGKN